MSKLITGLHHVTALASDPQRNVDFYAGILGLRMVKKTINFDAPEAYHLYYGNERGTPGTIMTFFPYKDIPKGRKGRGQVTATAFSISENAMKYWMERLSKFNIKYEMPQQRFDNEQFIYFEDYDGLGIELVANDQDERRGFISGIIPVEYAIKGFYSITLSEECLDMTAALLTGQMDHVLIKERGNRFRYCASDRPGGYVDVLCCPEELYGLAGSGTVHHVAFVTESEETQKEARIKLLKKGFNATPIINREYFHSVYFREPGGVLFEIATIPPGFIVDEQLDHLGESLKLPPWEEQNRVRIEAQLLPIYLDRKRFAD
jgi:glyoxalase family protein